MFKRLHNRKTYKGSGLGLAICQKIAQRLNGEILLESSPDQGSVFNIVLPLETPATRKEKAKLNQPVFKVLS